MTTETLRVFHLIKGLGRGGAEMLLPEGLRFADRAAFTYAYGYFLPAKDALVGSLTERGATVTCFEARGNAALLLAATRVAEHLERWRADVLHCHLPMAGAVGRVAGWLAGVPVVYTEHNTMDHYHPATRWLNRGTWRLQSRVIAVSTTVAASIAAHVRGPVRVDVIPNGVDVQRFDRDGLDVRELRHALGIPQDAPVVGTVAVMRHQKRLDDWLRAASLIRQRHPATHFLLVGDGPLRDALSAQRDALGLAGCVHCPGLQDDVRPYLALMDVFMMSSTFEGLPVALLEAMSMRCGVVCTAVGGIPEVVRQRANGALTPPGDPDSLAAAASELLSYPDRRARYGAAARETVTARFSLARMSRDLERVYTEVVQ